ncbi:hypothetical protein AQJ91_30395 [Streptomyces dysideae]|uniref:Uncharacterized protein n=1 Tax=Streptomyces dysideae TaxID=909626 RepID=A0A101UV61_9ACTN|nr:hypothetical protein AQJ91_30395 [Streptomyces dysideae]
MRTFLAATTGLPTIPPTTALVPRPVEPGPAPLVARPTTCLIVRPLHRPVPDERGPSVLSGARTGA